MAQAYQYENQAICKFIVTMVTSPCVKPLAGVLLEKGNSYNYIFNKISCSDMEREWQRKAKI